MNADERRAAPGLALRMQRERRVISAQHRQLDQFYLRVAAALDAEDAAAARAAFLRFADALEAHLALEDGLYFPALHGLAPELERDLEALSDEHHALREQVSALERQLEGGGCQECVPSLDRLVSDLAEHEGREEGLLASVTSRKGR